MKLTENDNKRLLSWGFLEKDFVQIEEATRKTKYTLDDQVITQREALRVLGRKTYLSGISRSAFHYSASRTSEDGRNVLFDSSALFR